MGHPFVHRLGLIFNKEVEQSPIFLLFLDCVWQLIQQYPSAFQFSETYLTTIWDSAHLSIFDTFLFNCEHDRIIAETVSINSKSFKDFQDPFTLDFKLLFIL